MKQITSCVFDLETTNLAADFGIVLCGCIKPNDGKTVTFRGDNYPTWNKNRSNDSLLLRDIVAELTKFDIWIAHNGEMFDIRFLRTRLLRWGMEPLPSKKLIDPLQLARNKLRMSYNSLAKLAEHLSCNTKTEVRPEEWLKAALDGSRKSMNYIVDHCKEDVVTLEHVVTALKPYSSAYNTYGSGR